MQRGRTGQLRTISTVGSETVRATLSDLLLFESGGRHGGNAPVTCFGHQCRFW
jgi:hypothetical protein